MLAMKTGLCITVCIMFKSIIVAHNYKISKGFVIR